MQISGPTAAFATIVAGIVATDGLDGLVAATIIAGMVHAVVLLAVLVFLMPYATLIPMPTIAAILLQVAYNMSGWRNFAHLCATASRGAVATLLLTSTLTIAFDLVTAIGVACLSRWCCS